MKTIIATFRLDIHKKEFEHFASLFQNRYTYNYKHFDGIPIVDIETID